MYQKLNDSHYRFFLSTVGEKHCLLDDATRELYGHDETEDLSFPPEIVLKPGTTDEVVAILRFCNDHRIPVTPLGARTGLSGGALSVCGGVGLSMERFNRILKIDTDNLQVVVEPAVIVQELQNAVAEHQLFYAVDPASRGSCWIGGNVSLNSGGPRAVKYGVTKDWVLNLEVVLPDGTVMETGANTLKNSTGYNLTQLFVGSEGTLGVITRITLKLLPLPKRNMLMLVPFSSPVDACAAVASIFKAGILPSALEFMEREAIELAMRFTGNQAIELDSTTQAHLLVEVDGNHEDMLMSDCERIAEVVEQHHAGEIMFADSEAQKDALWFLRRRVGEAVKSSSIYKEEDTVVPRFRLPELLAGVKELGKKYGFQSVCYGHAGDGNLHINILRGELNEQEWNHDLKHAIRELFDLTVSLGGTLSGEHGIGHVQKDYMDAAFSEYELQLMWKLNQVFD
ncbi:MAG: hypothetical protein RL226_1827 [Bacteroidota bacterium]